MKKALIVASVASMIDQFNMQNISLLRALGYEVQVACNFASPGSITEERSRDLQQRLGQMGVSFTQIDFSRNPLHLPSLVCAFRQMKALLASQNFSLVHSHSPIGGLVARLSAAKYRKHGLVSVYTAHGFHFYKGAPKKNWLIYYPIERFCSRFTDCLITINGEDYELAKKKLRAKIVKYVPGVGIRVDRFSSGAADRDAKREELGVPKGAKVLLSVGELNANKNHQTVIRAIAECGVSDIHYVIAGKGDKREELETLAKELRVNLHLLGYRSDIPELYKAADLFVHPSFREGLPVSVMEAMASGLPIVASSVRGCTDLVKAEGGVLCAPDHPEEFADGIARCLGEENRPMREYNAHESEKYDVAEIDRQMKEIYAALTEERETK